MSSDSFKETGLFDFARLKYDVSIRKQACVTQALSVFYRLERARKQPIVERVIEEQSR